MPHYTEVPVEEAADLVCELATMIERYGVVGVLVTLSDSCAIVKGNTARSLAQGSGDQASREQALCNFDVLSFAHNQIFTLCDAIEKYRPAYSKP